MPILNMVGGGKKGGNIGEPLNLTVTSAGLDATIKWEDNEIGTIPPTTFQKSELVRKIGSAPTSPSDGDLVVTETVKDTYKVSGYVDQGLTDGTTYYYRVFSYSDLGGISYCDAVSVTVSSQWHPGANTLLYMPLNSTDTYTDQSGNNVPTSNNGVTFGTYQGVDCGYFDRNNIQITTPFTIPSNITVLCWCYNTGVYYDDGKIFDARKQSGGYADFIFRFDSGGGNGYCLNCNPPGEGINDGSQGYIQNEWVLFAVTITNNDWNLYIKGVNTNISVNQTYSFTGFTPTTMNIGNEHDNGAPRYFLGGMSRIIVEDKARTATEIADYYNQTKGDYGIS